MQRSISIILIGLLLVLSLQIVLFRAEAQEDQIWTSTADFDAGTKSIDSDVTQSIRTIETTTDNPGISAGQFQLGNILGDDFLVDDADANTFKWDLCSAGTPTVNQREITAEILVMETSTNSGSEQAGVRGGGALTGDIDIQIRFEEVSLSGSGTPIPSMDFYIQILNEVLGGNNCGPGLAGDSTLTSDGFAMRWFKSVGDSTYSLQSYRIQDSTLTSLGTTTSLSTEPIWLRLSVSGSTLISYYSSDGSSWTQAQTGTQSISGNRYVYLYHHQSQDATNARTFRTFTYSYAATVGTPGSSSYVASGNWISPTFSSTTSVNSITLTYSSVSATNYIDSVVLQTSGGSVLETWGDNVISGTSVIYTSTTGSSGSLQVRIYLAGGGTGSVVIERVDADVASLPSGRGEETDIPGGGGFINGYKFDVRYPDLSKCTEVTIADTRPEAVLAILYIWNFGDKTQGKSTEPTINHTYKEEGVYTALIKVQYRGGGIEFFTVDVETRNGLCIVGEFVQEGVPILTATAGISVISATIVTMTRIKKDKRRLLIRALMVTGIISVLTIVSVAIYAYLERIPL